MKMRASADSTSSGANEGWAVVTTLIGGFVVWGGIGWLLDHWWGTHAATPIGLIVGMGLGIYAIVARYGHPQPVPSAKATGARQVLASTDPLPVPPGAIRRESSP